MLRAPSLIQEGPSANADWQSFAVGSSGRRLRGIAGARADMPDGLGDGRFLFLIAEPGLAHEADRARVGLTLIVDHVPSLDEEQALEPRVTGGVLSLDLDAIPGSAELAQVAADTGLDARAIFVRRARWSLIDEESGTSIADAEVHGNSSAGISQSLDRHAALSVLAALRGESSGIVVKCEAEFRAAAGDTTSRASSAASATTITMSTTRLGTMRTVELEAPLERVIGDATRLLPFDAIVRAVAPSADGTLEPIAWHDEPPREFRDARPDVSYAAVGDSIAALPALLKTSRSSRINAHLLAASGLSNRIGGRLHHWHLADLILHPPGSEEQNQKLPLIESDAPLWPDRVDPKRYWYAPQFSVRAPQPLAEASNAPFRFGFSVVGHDPDGRPALEAHARFTLDQSMAEATRAAWEAMGRPQCDPVPTNGLSATLLLPFVDESGSPSQTSIAAVEIGAVDGGVEIHFALTDRFARLAYGVLSTPGFQASQARIELSYCFPAYVPVDRKKSRVVWGGKSATVDVRAERRPIGALAAVTAHHAAPNLLAAQPHVTAAHAILLEPAIFVRPKTYGIRTQGRSQSLDVLFPCSNFGALYVEEGDSETGEAAKPIGCLDAWTLGQLKLRLYEPLDVDLGIPDAPYTVYRSMQVPGRFLVLPKAYTISRYEPSDWHGCRPALYLYSSVDAVHPEKTACILTGTLRPSLTPADRFALLDALSGKVHASPVLEWPAELDVEPQFGWAVPGGPLAIEPSAIQTPEGFQFSLGASVDHVLTLKSLVETSGISGSATFKLQDGSALQSSLQIALHRIDGPWEAGAVSVTMRGGQAELVNNTEAAADVRELLLYRDGIRCGVAPVEQRIEPRQKLLIDLAAPGADEAFASYSLAPTGASLEEIRTFVEDLHTNVVFICGFDLAAEQIQKVTVEGQIAGASGASSVELVADKSSGEIGFVLPLTAYLAHPTLRYRTTSLSNDGSARTSNWRDWRIDLQGNVIELTVNLIKEG